MIVHLPRESIESPVAFLLKSVPQAMAAIAPERLADLTAATADVHFRITSEGRFRCYFDPDTRTIGIDRKVIELMWTSAYSYYVLDTVLQDVKDPKPPVVVDLTANPRSHRAMQLLKWAVSNHVRNTDVPWPTELPRPIPGLSDTSDEHVADEIALCALAFLLHHEFAHARLGHQVSPPGLESILQEREADYAAADWILGSLFAADPHGPVFVKRTLGITVALATMVGLGIQLGNHGGQTHPRDFDRMTQTIERHLDEPNHLVWAFALAILKLHIDQKKIQTPDVEYSSVQECVNAYVGILADRFDAMSAGEWYDLG
jgi:hypothetical protein